MMLLFGDAAARSNTKTAEQAIVVELLFQPLRQAAFPVRHARGARTQGGYEDSHGFSFRTDHEGSAPGGQGRSGQLLVLIEATRPYSSSE